MSLQVQGLTLTLVYGIDAVYAHPIDVTYIYRLRRGAVAMHCNVNFQIRKFFTLQV